MGLASCASKVLRFSRAIITIRKPPAGRSLMMASTARAISCGLILSRESIAILNVRGAREGRRILDAGQWMMSNRQWTFLLSYLERNKKIWYGLGRIARTFFTLLVGGGANLA